MDIAFHRVKKFAAEVDHSDNESISWIDLTVVEFDGSKNHLTFFFENASRARSLATAINSVKSKAEAA